MQATPIQQTSPFVPSRNGAGIGFPVSPLQQDGGGTTVEDTEADVARRKHARIEAHLKAIQPLAHGGDVEAQEEVIVLTAQLKSAAETICDLKSPKEKLRILTAALKTRQNTLATAEAALEAHVAAFADNEAAVRNAKPEVELLSI